MAFSIARDKLTKEQTDKISKMLCFNPKTKDFSRGNYKSNDVAVPILFFQLHVKNKIEMVYLPYLFSSTLLQIIPNMDKRTTYHHFTSEFTGKLLERQVSVDKEVDVQLETYGTSTLAVEPGFGKTVLGARAICRKKLLACVLIHREILGSQWRQTFETFTNLKSWIVGEKKNFSHSQTNIPSMKDLDEIDVIICMDTRYLTIPDDMRKKIGFLIIDEAHAFCTPSRVGCLLAFEPIYILIETATLERDDDMHEMMYAMVGEHGVFRETNKVFNVVKIKTNVTPERKMTMYKQLNWPHLVSTTLLNPIRNDIINQLVSENDDKTILILTSLTEHVLLLNKRFLEQQLDCDYMCGTKKSYKDGHILIGTTSKLGTGFDQATACPDFSGKRFDLLILCCSIKKYSMLVQNVGRAFRSDFPTIFHLVDDDTIYEAHWRLCKKWYIRRGGILSERLFPRHIEYISTGAADEK